MPTATDCWGAARALAGATDGFALVELEGAMALRDAGIRHPILMLEGPYQAADLPLHAELELTPVLHTAWQVDALIDARLPRRMPVYLKLNTGMNRLGFNADEFGRVLDRLAVADCLDSVVLMTHFSDADEPRGIAGQMERFRAIVGQRSLPALAGEFGCDPALSGNPCRLDTTGHHALRLLAVPRHDVGKRNRPAPGDDAGK
jgi:alanine racemase